MRGRSDDRVTFNFLCIPTDAQYTLFSLSLALSFLFFLFLDKSLHISLAVLELTKKIMLILNSQRILSLCLLSAKMKGMCDHVPVFGVLLAHPQTYIFHNLG